MCVRSYAESALLPSVGLRRPPGSSARGLERSCRRSSPLVRSTHGRIERRWSARTDRLDSSPDDRASRSAAPRRDRGFTLEPSAAAAEAAARAGRLGGRPSAPRRVALNRAAAAAEPPAGLFAVRSTSVVGRRRRRSAARGSTLRPALDGERYERARRRGTRRLSPPGAVLQALATSPIGEELRPRGAPARRSEARAYPADHRAPAGRTPGRRDRTPVPQPAGAARRGDAVRADDGRERQPRHGAAVREVPASRGLPGRAAGRARARYLRHRFFPAEGEVAARDDADAARGVRRRSAATARRSAPAARGGAQDGQRRRRRARRAAGDRRRHARASTVPAARANAPGGSGQDRARPRPPGAPRGLGALPAPADLARTAHLRRAPAGVRGVRGRPTSARRPAYERAAASEGARLRARRRRVRACAAVLPGCDDRLARRAARPASGPYARSSAPEPGSTRSLSRRAHVYSRGGGAS